MNGRAACEKVRERGGERGREGEGEGEGGEGERGEREGKEG